MNIKIKSISIALINLIAGLFFYNFNRNLNILGSVENIILINFIILAFIGIILSIYYFIKYHSEETSKEPIILSSWYSTKIIVDIILIIAFLIRFLLIQPFIVIGASMEPNFSEGDYLLIDKISYRLRTPKRGEIIVFKYPESPEKNFIKRIIGLPGEKVEIKGGDIIIYNDENSKGVKLKETYIELGVETLGSVYINLGDDEYFVLGDNRNPNQSRDSREGWNVPRSNIVGKVWIRPWPFSSWHIIKTPEYNLQNQQSLLFLGLQLS